MNGDDSNSGRGEKEMLKDQTKTMRVDSAPLSLTLHLPNRISVPEGPQAEKIILHLEIRNRTNIPWEGDTRNGPMLEVVVLNDKGTEVSRQTRLCPMLAYPTRLEPGRGFNLPLHVVFPPVQAPGENFRIEARFIPSKERVSGEMRLEPTL